MCELAPLHHIALSPALSPALSACTGTVEDRLGDSTLQCGYVSLAFVCALPGSGLNAKPKSEFGNGEM